MATGWYKPNGVIDRVDSYSNYSVAEMNDSVEPGGGWIVADDIDRKRQYVFAGALVDRPELDIEPEYTITANGVDAVTFNVPDQTRVFVVNLAEREASADGSTSFVDDIADGDDTYTFTARRKGRWELTINPPEPTRRYEIIVEAI